MFRNIRHNLGNGFGAPAEGVGAFIPFHDELMDLDREVGFILEVRYPKALALKNAEPLFDLIHPGTMHRRNPSLPPNLQIRPILP